MHSVVAQNLEERVHADEFVRKDDNALAVDDVHRQVLRVDLRQRVTRRPAPGHVVQVIVEVFGIRRLGAGRANSI